MKIIIENGQPVKTDGPIQIAAALELLEKARQWVLSQQIKGQPIEEAAQQEPAG